jgi:hypothetical protein
MRLVFHLRLSAADAAEMLRLRNQVDVRVAATAQACP